MNRAQQSSRSLARRDQHHRDQPSLFEGTNDSPSQTAGQPEPEHAIPLLDPHVDESDFDRLSGQNSAVLSRLRRGPATNDELARLSRKYTSRISEVRRYLEQHGQTVVCVRGSGGLNTYRIASLSSEES